MEPRQTYNGPVEVWVGKTKRLDANAQLSGYVDVAVIRTLAGEECMDGVTSCDGYLHEVKESELVALISNQLDLKFPDGRVGNAVLTNSNGRLQGIRETPFD